MDMPRNRVSSGFVDGSLDARTSPVRTFRQVRHGPDHVGDRVKNGLVTRIAETMFVTHNVTSPPSFDALRKVYSIASSARASGF
jgi:hypothetical protein